jgi:YgiT-type zinc finger domain-containing protein
MLFVVIKKENSKYLKITTLFRKKKKRKIYMNTKITCDSCGGEAILKYRDIMLNDNKIIIKDEPYYKCQKCKDCFVTNEQMKKIHINRFKIN